MNKYRVEQCRISPPQFFVEHNSSEQFNQISEWLRWIKISLRSESESTQQIRWWKEKKTNQTDKMFSNRRSKQKVNFNSLSLVFQLRYSLHVPPVLHELSGVCNLAAIFVRSNVNLDWIRFRSFQFVHIKHINRIFLRPFLFLENVYEKCCCQVQLWFGICCLNILWSARITIEVSKLNFSFCDSKFKS